LDTLGVGATFYGSAPLYAPENKDGTTLLKPGQAGYYVLGEAYAALRHKTYGVLKGYRQLVEFPELSTPANPFVFPDPTHPYINPQDNRMTPNTFEALTAAGKVGFVRYLTGYLWNIKPRNADDFISMAEQASGTHSDAGVFIGSARLTPMPNLRIDLSEQYGIDTFNTFYAEGVFEYPASLARDWRLRFSAQFTDQRAVGDALVAKAADKYWSTQAGGARLQAIYRETFMLVAGFSITGSGNTIQAPWGAFPGYLSLIDQEFNRANERAALVGAVYDFGEYLPGLNATANFAWGRDAIDPKTRETEPDRREYDLTVEYRPPWLSGLWFRLRGAILDQQGADQLAWQFRLTVNWKMDVLL
jgi:hypothetical protein